jgi:hypothetical protein
MRVPCWKSIWSCRAGRLNAPAWLPYSQTSADLAGIFDAEVAANERGSLHTIDFAHVLHGAVTAHILISKN